MATGKRAFEGKTTASVIAAVLERNPRPSRRCSRCRRGVDRVVKTCVAKDPDERFQNVHDVKLQLKGDRGRWVASRGGRSRGHSTEASRKTGVLAGVRIRDS